MTLEEKRKRLHEYCGTTPCFKCELRKGGWEKQINSRKCLIIGVSPESDLDSALDIIGNIEVYEKAYDNVNHPAHYTDGKIEVIDFIEDKKLGFHLGNAVKYIARAGKKDPTKEVEDLKKADWYIKRRIEKLEEAK